MPKKSKYPKLRTHVKKGANGQVWVSYWYDMRGTGEKDIALGTDHEQAVARWDELHNKKRLIAGTIEEAFSRWEKEVLPKYTGDTLTGYTKHLRRLRPVFGPARWSAVTMKALKGYLAKRTAKTQANREMSVLRIVWNWARTEDLTDLPWPAHGMEKARWMNEEGDRGDVEVSDEAFEAIYKHADPILRDAMDIASATGLRVRDVLKMQITDVRKGFLVVKAGKTTKRAEFDLSASAILPAILEHRKQAKALHLKVLTAPNGREVSERMLTDRFAKARALAEKECPEVAGLILRDMRRRAAQLAEDQHEATNLLQHSSPAVTRKHYARGQKVRPVR